MSRRLRDATPRADGTDLGRRERPEAASRTRGKSRSRSAPKEEEKESQKKLTSRRGQAAILRELLMSLPRPEAEDIDEALGQ